MPTVLSNFERWVVPFHFNQCSPTFQSGPITGRGAMVNASYFSPIFSGKFKDVSMVFNFSFHSVQMFNDVRVLNYPRLQDSIKRYRTSCKVDSHLVSAFIGRARRIIYMWYINSAQGG